MALGVLVLAGWVFRVDAIKRIHPHLVAMKANTAACLLLAGAALSLLCDEDASALKRTIARVFAVGIAIVGALTIIQDVTGLDFGIDLLLFPESQAEAGRSIPGRMNPASAVNFILLGFALLLLDAAPTRIWTPAQVCSLGTMAFTFLIFLAYFYDLEMLHEVGIHASVAIHTVAAFLLLATGVLLARPKHGIMAVLLADSAAGIVARRLLPAVLLTPALLGWVQVVGQREGMFGISFGTALLVTAVTVVFTLLIWWTARALREMEAARAGLAAIVESSEDAILSKSLGGMITSWNAAAERLLGYPAAEIVGQHVSKIVPEDRSSEEQEILRRLGAGEFIKRLETERVARDGRRIDVSLTISPVRNSEGIILGASTIARDITERKKAAAALDEQRKRFAVTLASIGDAVIATDAQGMVTFLNPIAEAMTGWPLAEAVGRPLDEVFRIIDEKTRSKLASPATRVLQEGIAAELTSHTALVSRDGKVISIEESAAPIKDDRGMISGMVMVFHDVTERRLIEDAKAERSRLMMLRAGIAIQVASANQLDELLQGCCELLVRHLDAALASVWTLDEAGSFLEMRASAGSYTHFDGSHSRVSIGKSKIGRIAEERKPSLTTDLMQDPDIADPAWLKREGVVAFGGYPLILEERLLGVLALFLRRDLSLTEFEEIEPIADGIAQLIERKYSEISLRAAKEQAENASRAKDQFLAALSHELRTPLTPVLLLSASMEQAEDLPQQVRRDFAMIRQNVELEARIIDDLLDLTRITQGKLVLRFERMDPHETVAHALDILRFEIEEKSLAIENSLSAGEHHVNADAVRLEQVFWNVLKNAVKFTPAGGRIAVRSWNADGLLHITVSDTGIGITPDELPHIFNAFAQGAEAEAPRFGGLGLGLSISALLVREHSGKIWAESAGRGKGATFHIELPLVPKPRAAPAAHFPTEPAGNGTFRILLVDDHKTTRETLARLLSQKGHRVESAHSVAKALEVAGGGDFDLVISDLGLPDGDGHGLMRILRRDFGLRGIALSGYGMQADIEKSRDAGFDEHLTKPIDPASLEEAIQRTARLTANRAAPPPE